MQHFFVTSSGTGIGKTLVTTTLCWQLKQQGKHVTALKPVISGFEASDMNNDSALILKSCGLKPTPESIKTISPWRFIAPLSPHLAATQEKRSISLDELALFCRDHETLQADVVLVEGAGGVMTPINDRQTMLDWMVALQWPVILVVGSYLGTISHTLTAAAAIVARGLSIKAIVVSESEGSGVSLEDTVETFMHFVSAETAIAKLPRVRAADDKFKHAPSLSWICT